MNKIAVSTQKYTITTITYDDGSMSQIRENQGYSGLELVGLLNMVKWDVIKNIRKFLPPERITRQFIEEEKQYFEKN